MEPDFYIEEVENLVSELEHKHFQHMINLSDWNPSSKFLTTLAISIPYTFHMNPVSYIFSSDVDESTKHHILKKWDYSTEKEILFFNSGSESILNVLYFLSHQGCKKIYLLCPTYFSIEPICNSLSIECVKIFLRKDSGRYFLPQNFENSIENHECLWITNPIYCTGTLYSACDLQRIYKISVDKELYLVNDESLSLRKHALSQIFESLECYINIVTPHKALCTNGLKFSSVIISKRFNATMDKWVDILEGCLGVGAKVAIKHFLSPQYDIYESSFCRSVEENRGKITKVLNKYLVEYDVYSKSYLLSVYFNNLPYNYFDEISQMKQLLYATDAYVITGSKNSFPPQQGLSFRINLCRVDDSYLYALNRVLHYLQTAI